LSDQDVRDALDRLLPEQQAVRPWEGVLARAEGMRRGRRRRRQFVVAVLAAAVAGIASYTAYGNLARLGSDRGARGLPLRATLTRPDGHPAGSIRIKLVGASVTFFHLPMVHRFAHRRRIPLETTAFPARWYLRVNGVDGDLTSGRLYVRRSVAHAGSSVATLCSPCGVRDSGIIYLSGAQAAALVRHQLLFAVSTKSEQRAASGPVGLLLRRRRDTTP
jgi:hypothetical protein